MKNIILFITFTLIVDLTNLVYSQVNNVDLASPNNKSNISSNTSQLNAKSTLDNQSASANLNIPIKNICNVQLGLNQSFSTKPQSLSFLTLDGLSNGTTFSIGATKYYWDPTKIDAQALSNFLDEVYAASNKSVKREDLTADNLTEGQKIQYHINNGHPFLASFNYSINKADYMYINNKKDDSIKSKTFLNSNVKLAVGILATNFWLYSLSYTYQYKDNATPAVNYTFPVANSLLSQSKNVVVGDPSQSSESKFTIEAKKSFNTQPVFAIAPNFNYYVIAKKWSVSLPIYLFQNSSGALQGGFEIGYFSPTDKLNTLQTGFSGDIFIAAPFSLFGM